MGRSQGKDLWTPVSSPVEPFVCSNAGGADAVSLAAHPLCLTSCRATWPALTCLLIGWSGEKSRTREQEKAPKKQSAHHPLRTLFLSLFSLFRAKRGRRSFFRSCLQKFLFTSLSSSVWIHEFRQEHPPVSVSFTLSSRLRVRAKKLLPTFTPSD